MINLAKYYQPKKTVFIYLETDPEIKDLKKQLEEKKKAYFTTEGRDRIKRVWEGKQYRYIVWTYRTNQEERWIVVVLDSLNGVATIHTTSEATEAMKEQDEVAGFLLLLKGINNAKKPNLDLDLKTREARESSYVAVLYVLEILKAIFGDKYKGKIETSDFEDKESDGKSKIDKVAEKFKALNEEISKIPSLTDLEPKGTPPPQTETKTVDSIKADIKKLLEDTKNKWTNYSSQPNSTDLNIRMFKDFAPMAKVILPLINKALKSKQDFKDYFLLNEEWSNNSYIYNQSRDFLNAWYTFRMLLKEWETLNEKAKEKPPDTMLEANKKKIVEYEELKREKEKSDKRITVLEQQLTAKSSGKPKSPSPVSLTETLIKDIQENINNAYNSTKYLKGYYNRLMERILNWEHIGTFQQKLAVKDKRTEINKCIEYLKDELLKN